MLRKSYILLLLLTVILLLTGCQSFDYNKAVKLMDDNQYYEAIEILKTIPGYKDVDTIIQKEEMYQESLVYISQNNFEKAIETLQGLNDYRDSKELLNKEIEYEANYNKEKEIIDKALDIYNTKEFTDPSFSSNILKSLGNYESFKTTFREDAIILHVYSHSKKYVSNYWNNGTSVKDHHAYRDTNRDKYIKNLILLNPNSEGSGYRKSDISDVISNIKSGSENIYEVTKYEWESAYNNTNLIGANPTIGMTEEQVLISSWGKPEKINRTTTASGTYQQWVYSNYKYIYLDNGMVTAIQE